MSKIAYYKLNTVASVFYDPKNKLKITTGIPGKTDNVTKTTKDAARSGHIIVISENEYNKMMEALPAATRAAVEKDLPKLVVVKKVVKPDDEDDEDEEDDETDLRAGLLERLETLEMSKKELKKVSAFSDEDLEEYLIKNEA